MQSTMMAKLPTLGGGTREHKTPLREFGETIQYMVAHHKKMPKLESRFYKGIWLGRDTMTSESIVGIAGKIIRTRTIRRQVEPEKYDRQLMDIINAPPWDTSYTNRSITTSNDDTSKYNKCSTASNNRNTNNS